MIRLTKYLKYVATYLTVYGVFGFSLFIMEESIQSLQFGGWQLEKVGDYQGILVNSDVMEGFNKAMSITNHVGGWLNPIGFIAYRQYGTATDRYIYALRQTVMANAPDLMVGRRFDFNFRYNTYRRLKGGKYEVSRGKVKVIVNNMPDSNQIKACGLITKDQGSILIYNDDPV